ncbi:response regulator transcription factor [Synechococcus sp. PCC 7336]|uniref:response regulator transcription factor n=1 Tax=Synechococcus sp. PCC 7336 TaxID=195250 RepID=UPI0004779707|nr:response regulator transcription factor [Synechococcus sp. PCC 7336]
MNGTILLVDDEPGLRDAVQAYLEDSGFAVEAAANAQIALQKLQQNPPELIISDVMMPRVDGYAFLKQVREQPAYRQIPFIFLTAKGLTADRIQGYNAGVDAYLPKPFEPDELVAIAQNLLEKARTAPDTATVARELAEIKALLAERQAADSKPAQFTPEPPPIKVQLTPREEEVLDLVSEGLMNKEIARKLETSIRNVEKYVTRLLNKTGTNSRTELVRYAITYGLVQL